MDEQPQTFVYNIGHISYKVKSEFISIFLENI